MFPLRPLRSGILLAALVLAALALAPPRPAAAQCLSLHPPCTNTEPFASIIPSGGGVSQSPLDLWVHWSDDSGLNYATRRITVNGAVVTAQFTHTDQGAFESTSYRALPLLPGANTVSVEICDGAGLCSGDAATFTYTPPPAAEAYATPAVSLAPHHPGVRPPSPFEAVASYGTPAYVSRDAPRGATLLYTAGQARARAFVAVDATDNSTVAPQKISLRVKDAATGAWVTGEAFFEARQGQPHRLAAAWDAPGKPTGAHAYLVVVKTYWADGTTREAPPVTARVLLLNEGASPFGAGWTLAGHQQVVPAADGALVAGRDGGAVFFTLSGGAYLAPEGEFTTLTKDAAGYWRRRWPDGTEAVFHPDGRLWQVKDRFDQQVTWEYDASLRLSGVLDPAGKRITFVYGAAGRVSRIEDPGGRAAVLTIDAAGDLAQVTDYDGAVAFTATYGAGADAHRLRTRASRDAGAVWGFAYDAAGLLAADTLPADSIDGGAPQRPVVRYRSLESQVLGGAAPTPYVAPAALRAEVTDPRGVATRLELDRYGLPLTVRRPHGDSTAIRRNPHGQPTLVTAPGGAQTGYTWEGPHLVREYDYETDKTREVEYDGVWGVPVRVTDGGVQVRYAYGARGELLRAWVGADTTRYGYTPGWRLAWTEDPQRHRTEYVYQAGGFQNTDYVRETEPSGGFRQVNYGYDAHGRTESVTGPAGTAYAWRDALNRDTAVVDEAGRRTRFAYLGTRLHQVTDAAGKAYVFRHGPLGRLAAEQRPNGTLRYVYDAAGNVTQATNRRGQTVAFTHDSLGRVLTRTADGATTTFAYGPPEAYWTAAQNAEGTDTLFYDRRGRETQHVVRLGWKRYVLGSGYLDEGPRTTFTWQGTGIGPRVLTYTYDAALRLRKVTGPSGVADSTTFSHDADGLVTRMRLPMGVEQTFTYTPTHQPVRVRWSTAAADAALGHQLAYDLLDRVTSRTDPTGTSSRRYAYDAAGQLTGASGWAREEGGVVCSNPRVPSTCQLTYVWVRGDTTPYTYDAVGNRTDAGAALEAGSNRYSAFRGYTFAYDADGNLTHQYQNGVLVRQLTWNALGQLTGVLAGGQWTYYGYNGLGVRVRRTDAAGTRNFLYDGDDLVVEMKDDGTVLREYEHLPGTDQPLALWSVSGGVGTKYYYALESPGQVSGLFSYTGSVVNQYRYTPWGEAAATTEGVAQPLRYMARELDAAVGLYYVRNRWYDPVLGRFVSEDPIGLSGGINLYGYAANNPISLRDPLGLKAGDGEDECKAAASRIQNAKERATYLEWCLRNHVVGRGDRQPRRSGRGAGAPRGDRYDQGRDSFWGNDNWSVPADGTGQCLAAAGLAGLTVLSDVATLSGVGAVVRGGMLIYATGRTAGMMARNELVRDLAAREIVANQIYVEHAVLGTAIAVGGTVASDTQIALLNEAHGYSPNWRDFVPIVASYRAIATAWGECS